MLETEKDNSYATQKANVNLQALKRTKIKFAKSVAGGQLVWPRRLELE